MKHACMILMALLVATLGTALPTPARALSTDEIRVLNARVLHSRDRRVRDAWAFLRSRGIIAERPEAAWELPDLYPPSTEPVAAAAFAALQAARILPDRPVNVGGTLNETELLVDSDQIYPRALAMVDRAQRSICFDIFMWGGAVGDRLLEAFLRARDRGVDIRITTTPGAGRVGFAEVLARLDHFLTGTSPGMTYRPVVEDAETAGLSVAYYPVSRLPGHAFVKADHRKLLVIDGEEALVGGMNFADVIASNHDVMLWMRGPAAAELSLVFEDTWRLCRGEEITDFAPRAPGESRAPKGYGDALVTVIWSGAASSNTRAVVERALAGARRSLDVSMYTLTDDATVAALIEAHERGVAVRVLLDPHERSFGVRLMGAPNLATVRQLKQAGVPVRSFRTKPGQQLHTKYCVVDGHQAIIASTNWTKAGFDVNAEIMVSVEDPGLAGRLAYVFDHDWREVSFDITSTGLGRWILSTISEAVDGGI